MLSNGSTTGRGLSSPESSPDNVRLKAVCPDERCCQLPPPQVQSTPKPCATYLENWRRQPLGSPTNSPLTFDISTDPCLFLTF